MGKMPSPKRREERWKVCSLTNGKGSLMEVSMDKRRRDMDGPGNLKEKEN